MPTPKFPISPLIPGGYSTIDASALIAGEAPLDSRVGAVVGAAAGGALNTPLAFDGPAALKSVLRSGPAYDCARFMFMGGASRVVVVRAGSPVKAQLDLTGATGTPVRLVAKDPGAWGNSIRRLVEANNKITVRYTEPTTGIVYSEIFDLGSSATVQQIVDAINGKTPGIAGSTFVDAVATGTGTLPLATTGSEANLASGTDGAATLTTGEWTTALAALESEDVDIVVPAYHDAAIHAMVLAHCNAASTPAARRERTTVVGGVLGETPTTAKDRMNQLRSPRVQLVYPGAYNFDANGALKLWDPFYVAAYTAGRHLALPDPATSLTGAAFDWPDVERRLSAVQGGDQEILLREGVTPIGPTPGGGFQYVDSLAGYKADQSFRDFHKIRTADESVKRLRTRLARQFNGQKTSSSLRPRIREEATAELRDQVTEGLIVEARPPEVYADPDNNRSTIVNAAVLLPDTQKYILLTLSLQPPSTQGRGATL